MTIPMKSRRSEKKKLNIVLPLTKRMVLVNDSSEPSAYAEESLSLFLMRHSHPTALALLVN